MVIYTGQPSYWKSCLPLCITSLGFAGVDWFDRGTIQRCYCDNALDIQSLGADPSSGLNTNFVRCITNRQRANRVAWRSWKAWHQQGEIMRLNRRGFRRGASFTTACTIRQCGAGNRGATGILVLSRLPEPPARMSKRLYHSDSSAPPIAMQVEGGTESLSLLSPWQMTPTSADRLTA